MGADPGDDNFVAIVLGSLPASYETYLSALTGAATLLGKQLDPDTVLQGISDESDRKAARPTSKGEKEAAFYGNGGKRPKKTMECYNCHKGHMAKDCWAKGGGKEGQNPHRKGRGQANTAKTEQEFDVAWMAASYGSEDEIEFDEMDDVYSDLPSLLDVSDSDEEADDNEEDEKSVGHSEKTTLTPESVFTAAAPEEALDIYDSGASIHMTPSRHRLTNYRAIPPRSITAANNQTLNAIGMGAMHVEVLNGPSRSTRVLVKDVLHIPKLGPTLISIGRIARAGYAIQFRENECRIFDTKHRPIGTIPLVRGLYSVAVAHKDLRANVAASDGPLVATPEELHRLLGHLLVESAKT
jgi:hypothetical protein